MERIFKRHRRKNRAVRMIAGAAAVFFLFVLLFFSVCAVRKWGKSVQGKETVCRCMKECTLRLWKRWYPLCQEKNDEKEKQKGRDPCYEKYLENHKQWEEYQYLMQNRTDEEKNHLRERKNEKKPKKENEKKEDNKESPAETMGKECASDEILKKTELLTGKRTKDGNSYRAEQLADYDFLMRHFYTVHPTTTAGRELMNAGKFLAKDFALKPDETKPQILIYHTHSQEEFADYHSGNKEATIVGVGTFLAERLEEKGYRVIHDTTVYDLHNGKLDRSRAYGYALDGITGILQKNPTIQVILDIHRDGVKKGTRLVQEINGKPTATIMFFNGTSRNPSGEIEYLKNPYRTDNLAFSFQMKLCAEAAYPGFTRKIYLKGLRYNLHLRPCSALIEVGGQTNTYEEAKNAMEPLADILEQVLKGKED